MIVLARDHNVRGTVWYTVDRDGERLHKSTEYLDARRAAMDAADGREAVEDRTAADVVRWAPKGGRLLREGGVPAPPPMDSMGRLSVRRSPGHLVVALPTPGVKAVQLVLVGVFVLLSGASCAGGGVLSVTLAGILGPGTLLVATVCGLIALGFGAAAAWIGLHVAMGRQELVVDGDRVTLAKVHPLRTHTEVVDRREGTDVVTTDPAAEGDASTLNSSVLVRGHDLWLRVGQGLDPEERRWLASVLGHALLAK